MKLKVKLVYKVFPVLVLYIEKLPLFWKKFSGVTLGLLIMIKESTSDPEGLLKHELKHVEQFLRTVGMMPLLYLFSMRFRLKYEIEAYNEQVKMQPDERKKDTIDGFSMMLYHKYKMKKKYTLEEIKNRFYKYAGI